MADRFDGAVTPGISLRLISWMVLLVLVRALIALNAVFFHILSKVGFSNYEKFCVYSCMRRLIAVSGC